MAAKKKPAGIRSLVYGIGKGKGCIEGLSVSLLEGAEINYPLGLNGSLRPLAGWQSVQCLKVGAKSRIAGVGSPHSMKEVPN